MRELAPGNRPNALSAVSALPGAKGSLATNYSLANKPREYTMHFVKLSGERTAPPKHASPHVRFRSWLLPGLCPLNMPLCGASHVAPKEAGCLQG